MQFFVRPTVCDWFGLTFRPQQRAKQTDLVKVLLV